MTGPARGAGVVRRARPVRLAILLSGRGSNFLALNRAVEEGSVPAAIVAVVSNVAAAPGLVRARELGLPAHAVVQSEHPDRASHEAAVLEVLEQAGAEWVCLAGYMRLLSPRFVAAFPQRLVNIHPSLLPAFPGLEAQRQALEYGVKVSGCTVHLVDEGLDSGPIVAQRAVPVADGETVESLSRRILAEEHRLYPEALQRLLTEPWEIHGRRLVFTDPSEAPSEGPSGQGGRNHAEAEGRESGDRG